jgi:uncharacterized protein (TIGR02646 family)
MIPVTAQPEPCDFDVQVRQRGQNWLANNNIAFNAKPPKLPKLPNYWSYSNMQLWEAYSGQCAYLGIYFEWPTGASSTDHFIPKSEHSGLAYEWHNYRLSCLGPNRNKNKYNDVIDPIGMANETFLLNLTSGRIKPNPNLPKNILVQARKTITRLKLNSDAHKKMRARHYTQYLRHKCAQTLMELSPFVKYEAERQLLL